MLRSKPDRLAGRRLGRRLQPLEFGVADLGLGDQYAAAQALDEIAADRTEPARQRSLRAMADHDEMRADFLGDFGDLLAGIADLEPCSRRESQRPQALASLVQDGLVVLGLQFDRDRKPG